MNPPIPIIQNLPTFSFFYLYREDIPPIPHDRDERLAAQRGTQAQLLTGAPLSREGTQVTQIRLHSDPIPLVTDLFEMEIGSAGILQNISFDDIFRRFRIRNGVVFYWNLTQRIKGLIIKTKDAKEADNSAKITTVFLIILDRGYEFACAAMLNGSLWNPENDIRRGLTEVSTLGAFRSRYTDCSQTVTAQSLYSYKKKESWDAPGPDAFKVAVYRRHGFVHSLVTNAILALDEILSGNIRALRTLAHEIVQTDPICNIEISDVSEEPLHVVATRATSVIDAIRHTGLAEFHKLWTSPAVSRLTKRLLVKLQLPYLARAMYKTQPGIELPFGVLALPSTMILSELYRLENIQNTYGVYLIEEEHIDRLTNSELETWRSQGKALIELQDYLNVPPNPNQSQAARMALHDDVLSVIAQLSADLAIQDYYIPHLV